MKIYKKKGFMLTGMQIRGNRKNTSSPTPEPLQFEVGLQQDKII